MKLTNNSEILLNIDNFKYSCLYKFVCFGFISENHFKKRFQTTRENDLDCNPRFIENIDDFSTV